MIADIHFNHTLALKAIDAGAHCIRINPGNIGGHEKTARGGGARPSAAGVPIRIGVNSGSLPKHLHELERENSVEALVQAAVEYVELMERLDFYDFKVSIKSTSVPNTIASNRLLSERIDYPLHLGHHRGGHQVDRLAQVGGRPRHAAGGRHRRHDPHLALHLPRRGGGEGRLGDPQGAQAAPARARADRLPHLRAPPVRHGHRRGRDRAAARGLRGARRGGGARLRGERHRRGLARGLRHHRRQERGADLRPRQAAAEGAAGAAGGRAVRRDRQVARARRDRVRRAARPPRARSGSRRSRRRTPAS